jgi:hypothetical protein
VSRLIGADFVISNLEIHYAAEGGRLLSYWRLARDQLRERAIAAGATNPGPLRTRRYSEGVILSREQRIED